MNRVILTQEFRIGQNSKKGGNLVNRYMKKPIIPYRLDLN